MTTLPRRGAGLTGFGVFVSFLMVVGLIALGAYVLMQPDTILLDEPFAGLDLPTVARLTRRLATAAQQVITISHDPAAVAICDRVIWLDAGRIRKDGSAAEVLAAFWAEMARVGEQDADTHLAG